MSKKEEKTAVEKKKLELKRDEQLTKINNRIAMVDQITSSGINNEMDEMKEINSKFHESYQKRVVFSDELLKSRQNCTELKSKINKFVKQQNMLMIKLKSSLGQDKKGKGI